VILTGVRVLFVTPVEVGSGETITSVHLARSVVERGGAVAFLASAFAATFIRPEFRGEVRVLGSDGAENRRTWHAALGEFGPDVVVFADYPLLFFTSGASPLPDKAWVRSLDGIEARLVTLDHTGFAQRPIGLFFGPPHLSFHYESLPGLPERMEILLPCPMNEPGPVEGRRGAPFRYWSVPLETGDEPRAGTRARYLEGDERYLVFHASARWAWEAAEAFALPHYRYLPTLLENHLAGAPHPVRLVSVNNGRLLPNPRGQKLRVTNLRPTDTPSFEALLFASDLLLTENRISITLGKAICGYLPSVALVNSRRYRELLRTASRETREILFDMESERPGAVFPYEIFPSGMRRELEQLGLYRDNSITRAFTTLELYAEETGRELVRLLVDDEAREAHRARQRDYVQRLARLDDGEAVLRRIVGAKAAV
jgi:Family of unknown function (DUF6365)